jgi:hypothetical protein
VCKEKQRVVSDGNFACLCLCLCLCLLYVHNQVANISNADTLKDCSM